MWSGEEDFKPLLQKALLKPSKGSLTAVTDVAVRDEKWCYKSVCFDLEKAAKRVHKKQRLNVLYIISDICRKSKSRLASKDKYGARFQKLLPVVLQRLDAAPVHHVVQAEKVLSTWRREGLFAPDTLSEYEQILAEAKGKAGAASQAHLSAIKELPAEERAAQAPELSPDTYDPFQTSLEDPPMPDDVDLPGPPPLAPGNDHLEDTPQLEPSPKRLRMSPRAAAKETAEQSGSVARAQAIANRLAASAGGLANGTPAEALATVDGDPEQARANGLAAEPASLPVAAGIPGVSTAEQQAKQDTSSAPQSAAAEIPRRRRPSMFDAPAVEAQLPPPPQLPEQLPGPPPQPPPQPQPQLQSNISRESQESMRDRAQAIAARFAASAMQNSLPAPLPTGDSSQGSAAKQPGTAGASAESEFEDDSDPFHNLPPIPPAPALPLPQAVRPMSAQPHSGSLSLPPPVAKQPESHASQPALPPPPQGPVPGAWEGGGSAAQQRAPQPPRGPPPGHPQVPPPRPPPPGPRPPPGAPPAHPPPQHYPQYPPNLHARPPPGPPPGASAWHAPLPQNFPPQMGGWNHQGWAMNQGAWNAASSQAGGPAIEQSKEVTPAEDSAPPPPPPLPSQTDAPAVY
ncbi:g1640 [Coccomyxa viridis]|uniref:G1640 protein n=1 Tax=Coccomyxa viridis TaxID=1274662 RepID=A0ABP1FNW3_9CHLO